MATLKFDASAYVAKLNQLGKSIEPIAKMAVYDAAKIVTDAITDEIKALPTVRENQHGTSDKPLNGVTEAQKSGLLEGVGIARMRDEGGVINTKIGFDGYNKTRTRKFPNGQPNALIARSVEHGTTFRTKNRFIKRAVDKSKPKAEKAIADRFDSAMAKIFE